MHKDITYKCVLNMKHTLNNITWLLIISFTLYETRCLQECALKKIISFSLLLDCRNDELQLA